jgi:hypothetical protein
VVIRAGAAALAAVAVRRAARVRVMRLVIAMGNFS